MTTHLKNIFPFAVIALFLCFTITGFGQKYKDRGQQENNTEYRQSQENPDSLSHKSFTERLLYGGNFWLEIGNTTYIDISPLVGYRLTPKWQAGLGATYIYYRALIPYYDPYGTFIGTVPVSTTLYGGRVYTQYDLLHDALRPGDKLFGHFEYEMLNVPYVDNLGKTGRTWIESPYIGAGYRTPFGRNGYFNLTFLYNLDYARFQNLNPYGSPFEMRIGFSL